MTRKAHEAFRAGRSRGSAARNVPKRGNKRDARNSFYARRDWRNAPLWSAITSRYFSAESRNDAKVGKFVL
jgi:hypothetical protein